MKKVYFISKKFSESFYYILSNIILLIGCILFCYYIVTDCYIVDPTSIKYDTINAYNNVNTQYVKEIILYKNNEKHKITTKIVKEYNQKVDKYYNRILYFDNNKINCKFESEFINIDQKTKIQLNKGEILIFNYLLLIFFGIPVIIMSLILFVCSFLEILKL